MRPDRLAGIAVAATCVAGLGGCATTEPGAPIAILHDGSKQTMTYSVTSYVLENRFLLLWFTPTIDSQSGAPESYVVDGLRFRLGRSSAPLGVYPQIVKLRVVDLAGGGSARPVLEDAFMGMAIISRLPGVFPRFPGFLFVVAAADANGDREINHEDPGVVYCFELHSGRLTRISPAGYAVVTFRISHAGLVLLLRNVTDGTISVYEYRPRDRSGRIVADEIGAVRDSTGRHLGSAAGHHEIDSPHCAPALEAALEDQQ